MQHFCLISVCIDNFGIAHFGLNALRVDKGRPPSLPGTRYRCASPPAANEQGDTGISPNYPPGRADHRRPTSTPSTTSAEPVAVAACSRQSATLPDPPPPSSGQLLPVSHHAWAERHAALSRHKRRRHRAGPHALPTGGNSNRPKGTR